MKRWTVEMKEIKDYTLGEVKEICENNEDCENCIFKSGNCINHNDCLIFSQPNDWNLNPKYTDEQIELLKAVKILFPACQKINGEAVVLAFTSSITFFILASDPAITR